MVVMFFQEGVGPGFGEEIAELSGFVQVEASGAWVPVLLCSIVVGLSVDCDVFLVGRGREHLGLTGGGAGQLPGL